MTRSLVILGTSGNALDVMDIVDALSARGEHWQVLGILDDSAAAGSEFHGVKVLGKLGDAEQFGDSWFVNAIGSDKSFRQRPRFVAQSGIPSSRFATLIHPHASVSTRARLGRGVVVNAGAVIAGSVTIGDHVCVGPGCIIGHDSTIESHAVLAPGAIVSGFCRLGVACYIGAGAMIRQRLRVGAEALVGMGAVVIREVPDGATVVGSPARPLE